jgi:two-component system nitrogen regulation response regulator GlnG
MFGKNETVATLLLNIFVIINKDMLLLNRQKTQTELKSGTMNLLLIDGDEKYSTLLSSALQKKNLSIRLASTSTAALKILGEGKIDLILSSTEVPGSQTLLFLCSVKGRYPDTPLILLSDHSDNGALFNANTAFLLGADALIPRSRNFSQLYSTISKYTA